MTTGLGLAHEDKGEQCGTYGDKEQGGSFIYVNLNDTKRNKTY